MVLELEPGTVRGPALAGANPAQEVVAILGRRRHLVLSVFLLVTSVVAVGAMRTPPVFVAESSLLVRMGREYIYRPEVGRADTARTPSLSEIVNSEVEILSSRDLAELVVVQLGIEKLYGSLLELGLDPAVTREMAVMRFRQATSVRPVLESSVIKVRFEHESSRVAAEAVNLLVERFKDKHVEVFGEEGSSGLEDQHAARRAELLRAEEALAEFKRTSGVSDLDEQRTILLGQRARMEDELRACELQLHDLRPSASSPAPGNEQGEAPDQRSEPELAAGALDPPTDRLIEEASLRLLHLRIEESELRRDYGPENRRVQGVRTEIELVEGILRQARLQAVASGEARRLALGRELADLDQRIEDLDQREKTLRQLERELTAAESALQIIRERVEEARISEELDRERRINVRVIEKAAAPVAPDGLSFTMKLALGAFVGLLAGAALAYLLELVRRD
jgi:uncharacterized protein involved in exopolysaccharide biosynthesis